MFLVVINIVSNVNQAEYIKIPLLGLEYYFYHLLSFYTKVLKRSKNLVKKHNIAVNN